MRLRNTPMAKFLRSSRDIWLIGPSLDVLKQTKLPPKIDVLRNFFYYHFNENKTVTQSAKMTIVNVAAIWDKANIPTTSQSRAQSKLLALHKEYTGLKKTINRVKLRTRKEMISKRV